MASSRRSAYTDEIVSRYRQGDIIREMKIVEWAEVIDNEIIVLERSLPYGAILSQECDLEHDYNNRADLEKCKISTDKFLQMLLVCPAYIAEDVRQGTHLPNHIMQSFGRDQWKRIKQNNDSRYHFLAEDPEKQVPDLVIDFKHYFTIPRAIAYRDSIKSNFVASLDDLFREHLSNRFAHYLSRIGLPEIEFA